MIRIGDIVRFLNDVGGGRVVEIKGSTVTVEDSDGFRIPCPERECVVVESAAIKDAGAKPSEKAFSGEIQTRGGDMLEISLAYVPVSQSGAAAGDYDVYIINESNYSIYVQYIVKADDKAIGDLHGSFGIGTGYGKGTGGNHGYGYSSPASFDYGAKEFPELASGGNDRLHRRPAAGSRNTNPDAYYVEYAGSTGPYGRDRIFRLTRARLNEISRKFIVRILPFKSKSLFAMKDMFEIISVLDPKVLLNASSFKENRHIGFPAYVIPLVKENGHGTGHDDCRFSDEIDKPGIEQALLENVGGNRPGNAGFADGSDNLSRMHGRSFPAGGSGDMRRISARQAGLSIGMGSDNGIDSGSGRASGGMNPDMYRDSCSGKDFGGVDSGKGMPFGSGGISNGSRTSGSGRDSGGRISDGRISGGKCSGKSFSSGSGMISSDEKILGRSGSGHGSSLYGFPAKDSAWKGGGKPQAHHADRLNVWEDGTVSEKGIPEYDLHADNLLETTAGMSNSDILHYQLDYFRRVMGRYYGKKRGVKVVFIHGKGDGVLRQAILKALKSEYRNCRWQDASFREYGYGATMVIF